MIKPQEERLSDLDNSRRCWATISQLCTDTGYCQGTACGYLSLTAFVSYLISIYGFFSSINIFAEEAKVEWQLLLPLIFYSLFFYAMFDRGESTTKEV
ncbi:unnamed protein product [Nezara viridula]|uniref:Uncharacterized protein n=1 Tax=Nezara viridula TaxID=85310 RepID=A0A9P0HAE9_NEZVI|nr:unnamed protein product [Nezara viridula]